MNARLHSHPHNELCVPPCAATKISAALAMFGLYPDCSPLRNRTTDNAVILIPLQSATVKPQHARTGASLRSYKLRLNPSQKCRVEPAASLVYQSSRRNNSTTKQQACRTRWLTRHSPSAHACCATVLERKARKEAAGGHSIAYA